MKKLLITISAVIVVAAAGAGGYLLNKKPQPVVTAKAPVAQVATCKSGTSQTLANAGYLVGTDIMPGNYKLTSQPASDGWATLDIYDSKADYTKDQDPNNKQHVNSNYFEVYNQANDTGEAVTTTYTKLSEGQYVVVSYDPAVFTCE